MDCPRLRLCLFLNQSINQSINHTPTPFNSYTSSLSITRFSLSIALLTPNPFHLVFAFFAFLIFLSRYVSCIAKRKYLQLSLGDEYICSPQPIEPFLLIIIFCSLFSYHFNALLSSPQALFLRIVSSCSLSPPFNAP